MSNTRTSIFTVFGLSNTHGKIRFHSSNVESRGGETFADMTRRDGRNKVRMLLSPVGMTRGAGASWFKQQALKLNLIDADEVAFLKTVIKTGAPVTRVHGFGNGKFYQGQAVAAKRA